jgi:hypothetical protein
VREQFFGDTARMRSVAAVSLVAWLAIGCHPPDPARRMRHAELIIAGGLIGVLASSAVIGVDPPSRAVMVPVVAGFGALAIAGVVTYIGASLADTQGSRTQQQIDEDAWQLTKRARDVARNGDCDRVKKIAPAVKDKDASFYDAVFIRDAAIQRCLGPAR